MTVQPNTVRRGFAGDPSDAYARRLAENLGVQPDSTYGRTFVEIVAASVRPLPSWMRRGGRMHFDERDEGAR